jgi:hypothetical protein
MGRINRIGSAIALLVLLGVGRAADAPTVPFEFPPELPPSALLPPALSAGPDFHVEDPVLSDGLMAHFVVYSRFGRYEAYGATALRVRVSEIYALARLEKTSGISIVAGGVGRGVSSQIDTVTTIVRHPVDTVTGIPRGIAHLFHGTVDEGKEAMGKVRDAGRPSDQNGKPDALKNGEESAKRYASQYLGVTASERRWYEKLGVDPYTPNAMLRDAIHRTARLDAATSFGMRFVGVPGLPEIGELRRALDAIYKEDPATLRARDRATLRAYGMEAAEIERWQNTIVLSPTRQVILLQAAQALDGVAGRAELFRHALGLSSDIEAQVYLASVALLVRAHHDAPVASILPGVRLPSAARADGSLVVCGAFDAVYWTADVAGYAEQVEQSLALSAPLRDAPPGGGGGGAKRLLLLSGRASARARQELESRGWELHEAMMEPPGQEPGPSGSAAHP